MRHRTLIQLVLAGTVLLAAAGIYAFCYGAVGAMSRKAAALDTEIRTKSEESARVAAAKEALASLAADEASMRQYLVRQEEIVPFLGRLEGTGAALGSSLQVVSVSTEKAAPRGRILLSVKITGSFESVLRTLGAIEYGPYDSAVTNVTLDTSESEPGQTAAWSAVATFTLGTQRAVTP